MYIAADDGSLYCTEGTTSAKLIWRNFLCTTPTADVVELLLGIACGQGQILQGAQVSFS